ncbi:MAG: hypothetical protein COB08_014940 [Rhodobacteraceae bacterium]|nr:hypothetical protein [Paracoccaceae bacterium]
MNLQRVMILGTLVIGAIVLGLPAEAQFSPNSNPPRGGTSGSSSDIGLRLAFVATSTIIGFGIGWLLSGKGKDAREVIIGMLVIM